MTDTFIPKHGWGPDGRRAALSITDDNLGEAAEVELGLWGDQPVGQHHTARFNPNRARRQTCLAARIVGHAALFSVHGWS